MVNVGHARSQSSKVVVVGEGTYHERGKVAAKGWSSRRPEWLGKVVTVTSTQSGGGVRPLRMNEMKMGTYCLSLIYPTVYIILLLYLQ